MAGAAKYTDAERLSVFETFEKTRSKTETARILGIPRTSVHSILNDSPQLRERIRQHVLDAQLIDEAMDPYGDVIEWEIDPKGPVHVYWVGDEHLGALGVDYDACERVQNFILNEPDSYCIKPGDVIENTPGNFVHQATPWDQVPPAMQKALANYYFFDLADAGKLIAVQDGNHEERTAKRSGEPTLATGLSTLGVTVTINAADCVFKVGSQTYYGVSAHHLAGSSINNDFNAHLRVRRLADRPLHFVLAAHSHKPGIQHKIRLGMDQVDGTCGTFKTKKDRFLRQHLRSFDFGIPRLTFYPDRPRVDVAFMRVEDFDIRL